ncbi:MAG: type IV pilus modification protein PilV [Candidatus Competibacterales bacterium]
MPLKTSLNNYTFGAPRKQQRGSSLLEILIALIVLGVGLLGLANLQAAGMRANHDAYLRSQAVILLYNILDRIHAQCRNQGPACMNEFTIDRSDATPTGTEPDALKQWFAKIESSLPSGDGQITTGDTLNGGRWATIQVSWLERPLDNPALPGTPSCDPPYACLEITSEFLD